MSLLSLKKKKIEACRLELSLNPEDGSLLTAPLSRILIAATDGLYTDLYNMGHGELEVHTPKNSEDDDPESSQGTCSLFEKRKMSSLNFNQRRHEISTRLAIHGKAIGVVAALTGALFSTEMAEATIVPTKALKHARTAWVQADEAQDALYFFHAQLFPARQAPHDIFGALDLLKRGEWKDLPSDLRLLMDRYGASKESGWSPQEVKERWNIAVRDKLIRGEVADLRRRNILSLWKISISGGIVKLTHGKPKNIGSQTLYPLEAYLTVWSTAIRARWTLLKVEVRAQAKTGESNHQLDTTNRQRYALHRLCAKAMKLEEDKAENEDNRLSRPLDCLFQVAHNFSLSWRLEILSAQAQALKRGVWSSKSSLVVAPVEFFREGDILGIVSISFWKVDDRYGPPRMSSLAEGDERGPKLEQDTLKSNQLTLSIQAFENLGMKISLSGGERILDRVRKKSNTCLHVGRLLDAASNPFALSASNALLAATTLCAEERCHAMVEALQPSMGERLLPTWLNLTVVSGSIAVSAQVFYHSTEGIKHLATVLLFRMACDARTGTFVTTFCRSANLLRLLASNEPTASESMALRMSKLVQNRRRAAATNSSGRLVRDAFEGLSRSMNLLGTRCGVGGPWLDKDTLSASLRLRAIQLACKDAKNSLITCCGMAAVNGLGALAAGVATGTSAQSDICGGPIDQIGKYFFLEIPPVGIILDQNILYNFYVTNGGEKKKKALIEREIFALGCSANTDGLIIHAFDISTSLESPSSIPIRKHVSIMPFRKSVVKPISSLDGNLFSKRMKVNETGAYKNSQDDPLSMVDTISHFADIIAHEVEN